MPPAPAGKAAKAISMAFWPFSTVVTSAPAFFNRKEMNRWLSRPSSASRMRQSRRGSGLPRRQGLRRARRWPRWGAREGPRPPAGRDRCVNANVLPSPGWLRDGDVAAEEFGQALADRQAQSGAAEFAGGRGLGLLERPEKAVDLRGGHADARIDDLVHEPRLQSVAVGQADDDPHAAGFGELDGVADQVQQDLPQAGRIGRYGFGQRSGEFQFQTKPLAACPHPHQRNHFGRDRRRRTGLPLDLEFSGLDLREVEDVVDDGRGGGRRCGG